jgi:hypothetical protein
MRGGACSHAHEGETGRCRAAHVCRIREIPHANRTNDCPSGCSHHLILFNIRKNGAEFGCWRMPNVNRRSGCPKQHPSKLIMDSPPELRPELNQVDKSRKGSVQKSKWHPSTALRVQLSRLHVASLWRSRDVDEEEDVNQCLRSSFEGTCCSAPRENCRRISDRTTVRVGQGGGAAALPVPESADFDGGAGCAGCASCAMAHIGHSYGKAARCGT